MEKQHLLGMTSDEISNVLGKLKQPKFRAKQVCDWIFAKRVSSFDDMRNVPKDLRNSLAENFMVRSMTEADHQVSANGMTEKWLLKTSDGHGVECVLIMDDERRTACVSCSLGCPLSCTFCASAKGPFIRNLAAGEIVEQVVFIENKIEGRISNVVFMGTGEPFLNYDEVMLAARRMNAEDGLGIGARHITISTAGVINGIERFGGEPEDFRLALSLHAPTQAARQKVIPSSKKWPLPRVISAIRRYTREKRREVTFEYILIKGFNAHPNDAESLCELLNGIPCKINLIPYNPAGGGEWEAPDRSVCREFASILKQNGIRATVRAEKGSDINAACGQLRAYKMLNSAKQE
jgi:23S rRNA (adenine2503-C2)-methyltransferase